MKRSTPSFSSPSCYSASTGPERPTTDENGSEPAQGQEKAKPGLSRASRGSAKTDLDRYRDSASESEVQSSIVEGLRWLKYTVLVTSRQWRRCPKCHSTDRRGDGATPGIPDLLVFGDGWPALLGLEVKTRGGTLTVEQQELREAGAIHVVRSIDEAREAVEMFERGLGLR